MNQLFSPNKSVRLKARLIVESWNLWRTLPIVVMSAEEYADAMEKQKFLNFGDCA